MENQEKTKCVNCFKEIPKILTRINKTEILTCCLDCERTRQELLLPPENEKEKDLRLSMLSFHSYREFKKREIEKQKEEKIEDEDEPCFAWDEPSILL